MLYTQRPVFHRQGRLPQADAAALSVPGTKGLPGSGRLERGQLQLLRDGQAAASEKALRHQCRALFAVSAVPI